MTIHRTSDKVGWRFGEYRQICQGPMPRSQYSRSRAKSKEFANLPQLEGGTLCLDWGVAQGGDDKADGECQGADCVEKDCDLAGTVLAGFGQIVLVGRLYRKDSDWQCNQIK